MRRIRASDTKPEKLVRSVMHRAGYRYTVRGPANRRLPGKPDVVLPRHRLVVFVHGCFWHLHTECREGRTPSSNQGYWAPKLARNVARDTENLNALAASGWRSVVFWECEIERAMRDECLDYLVRGRIATALRERSLEQVAQDPNIC